MYKSIDLLDTFTARQMIGQEEALIVCSDGATDTGCVSSLVMYGIIATQEATIAQEDFWCVIYCKTGVPVAIYHS